MMITEPLVKRHACAVCGLRANVLVCKECADRPDIVETIEGWLRKNADQAALARKPFIDMQLEHHTQWYVIEHSRLEPTFARRAAEARAAGNIYGQLLDAEQAMTDALAPLEAERARLTKALEAVQGGQS